MGKVDRITKTFKASQETIDEWNLFYENSLANSQGEFAQLLLDKWNSEDPAPKTEIQTVEKQLEPNQVIINLTPAQLFAIRSNVTSSPHFAEKQNKIIDSLNGGRPFLYFGNLYDPEFKNLWVRNIPVTKEMTEEQKENAIRHNMAAFLVNMFLMHAIEGNLSVSNINAERIKAFIKENTKKQQENEQIHRKPVSTDELI